MSTPRREVSGEQLPFIPAPPLAPAGEADALESWKHLGELARKILQKLSQGQP